jgi:glycosyltransferase involved in cell wall biosynthesis
VKIRFLLHDAFGNGGGVLTVTFTVAQQLALDHDVEIVSALRRRDQAVMPHPANVTVRTLADLRPELQPGGVRGAVRRWATTRPSRLVHRSDPRHRMHNLYSDWRLLRYVASVRTGALVGMQPGMNLVVARWGRRGAVRVVQDHRPFQERSAELRAAYTRHAARLDAFLTLTHRDARHARRAFGDRVPVRVMRNPAPPYTGPLSDQSNPVVVAAGRLERSKGFDLLLTAWAQVVARHPGWRLRIFGQGSAAPELQQQLVALGLEGSAELGGYTNRLQEEMAAASLFVLSSRREGYPMVMLEAMGCGLPVVSFDCPSGPGELMGDGDVGALVANGDVDALAEAIIGLVDAGAERRRTIGAAAWRRAQEHSPDVVARRWSELLTELEDVPARHRPGLPRRAVRVAASTVRRRLR